MERVELHLHTNMSQMDGTTSISDYIKKAVEYGMTSIAITDHGVVQAFPEAHQLLGVNNPKMKVIYGMEGYVVNDDIKAVYNFKGQSIDTTYCMLDLETTGFSAINNEITEIGILKVKDKQVIDRFHSYIKPKNMISNKVSEITGITNKMVDSAESIEQILPKVYDFLGNSKNIVLVFHNADFDVDFLKQNSQKIGYDFDYTYIDTLILAKALFPNYNSYRLQEIANELEIKTDVAQTVLDEVNILLEIYNVMNDLLKTKDIKRVEDINKLINKHNIKEEIYKKIRTYHTSILVKNEIGLKNLYKIISASNLNYFYKKPILLKSILQEYREGLLIGSACEMGELYKAIELGKTNHELEKLVKFYDYLEIQPIANNYYLIRDGFAKDEEDLKNINIKIVELGRKLNKLVVATGDVHFLNKEDEVYRRILQAGQGYKNADNQPPLYFRTTEEMLKEFDYLEEETAYDVVVTNTNKIADMCEQISPVPPEKCYPHIENSEEEIKELTYKGAYKIYGNTLPKEVKERLDKELKSIIENGYATLYMIAQRLVSKSNKDGYIVGSCGRVGSSLVAHCIGITEIDPIKYNIPFEIFAGLNGKREPDIDLNFVEEYQPTAQEYIKEIIEGSTTYKCGVIGTITDKMAYRIYTKIL